MRVKPWQRIVAIGLCVALVVTMGIFVFEFML